MKKNLLSLALIFSAGIYTYAQNTYINDAVTVKVNPNTLFFHGGDVSIINTSTDAKKIINEGNIQINGNFSNQKPAIGDNPPALADGKNFVNVYTVPDLANDIPLNYGQLIISKDGISTGRITVERKAPNTASNEYHGIGLPFQTDNVSAIINSMAGDNAFKGTCALNTPCGDRYKQTILKWDIAQTEYDAVTSSDPVSAGANYTLNLQNIDGNLVRSYIDGLPNLGTPEDPIRVMSLTGIPFNGEFNNAQINPNATNIISGIKGHTKEQFSRLVWSDWKNKTNNYNETFNSYLGLNITGNDANQLFGKNLHRFSNPYTSNIDISKVGKTESWIKFNVADNSVQTPTEAYTNALRFKVSRLPETLEIHWADGRGGWNTIGNSTPKRISAQLAKDPSTDNNTPYYWIGDPAALIIKPTEYFEVNYYTINANATVNNGNTTANGNGSAIISANYSIGDLNKTFANNFDGNFGQASTDPNIPGVYARNNQQLSNLLNDENLIQRGLIGPNDFTQIQFYLTKNNLIEDEAVYLVNSNAFSTGNVRNQNILENKLFLYEETTNGTINRNVQTLFNEFKSDYVGKPLGIGFNDLTMGDSYSIKLNLFEYSILNQVNNFNNGTYYLLDKNTNHVTEVNANTVINFIADANSSNRFELYWNEIPHTLGTDNLETTKQTYVYNNNKDRYVRFEDNNTTATVKVFDLAGRLISTHDNVNTSEDLKLKIDNTPSIYIINITYKNGKVVSKKIIQN